MSKSLPDWSAEMNESVGSDMYAEGLSDNILKQGSVWLDRLIEATGAPALGKEFGGAVGGLIGNEEAGARIGEGLARQVVDTLPMFVPGVGPVARLAKVGGMAAMSGLNTYEKTGSVGAGVVSGLVAGASPGASQLVEQLTLKAMGRPLVQAQVLRGTAAEQLEQLQKGVLPQVVKQRFAENIPQGLASVGAGQLAAGGLGVAGDIGFAGDGRAGGDFFAHRAVAQFDARAVALFGGVFDEGWKGTLWGCGDEEACRGDPEVGCVDGRGDGDKEAHRPGASEDRPREDYGPDDRELGGAGEQQYEAQFAEAEAKGSAGRWDDVRGA